MKSATEFLTLTKPKMVVAIIEIMVWQGYDITDFIYKFRSYKKQDLILSYQFHLDQEPKDG